MLTELSDPVRTDTVCPVFACEVEVLNIRAERFFGCISLVEMTYAYQGIKNRVFRKCVKVKMM